mgnify:CR=1 FL=1
MNFSLSPENISAWREGHVMNDIVFNLGCCCPGQGTEEVFSYIEVIYKDGNRHYFYENQIGFDRFEKDFYDKRFTVKEIMGRSVVLHSGLDDFTSQPSGNPGVVIGCGVIRER